MAGLFDFKSAEDILQERRTATKANQQQLLSSIVAAAPKESRQASMLGAQLGIALGRAMGAKAEQEQLTEFREMGETTQAMEQAGVGGEGSAQFDGEGSSYGAGVQQQAQAEEQRRLGLLSQDVQQAEKAREGRANLDLNTPEGLLRAAQLNQDLGGDIKQTMALSDRAKKLQAEQKDLEVQKIQQDSLAALVQNPDDQEAVSRFIQTGGSVADLKAISDYSGNNNLVVVGNRMFDKDTGQYINPTEIVKQVKDDYIIKELKDGSVVRLNKSTGETQEVDLPNASASTKEEDARVFAKLQSDLATTDMTLGTIEEAMNLAGVAGLDYAGRKNLAGFLGGDARILQAKLRTISANLAFDRLTKMRNESKTGGALGQVSNIELELLKGSIASLDLLAGASPEELRVGLEKVKKHYTNFKNAMLGKNLDIDWQSYDQVKVVDGTMYWEQILEDGSNKAWTIKQVEGTNN